MRARHLKLALIVLAGLLATAPVAAEVRLVQPPGVAEGAYKGQCRRLERQITTHTEQAGKAYEAGNDAWVDSNLRRIAHLSTRRARLCPRYENSRNGEELLKLLRLGGKVALKMYTMGIL